MATQVRPFASNLIQTLLISTVFYGASTIVVQADVNRYLTSSKVSESVSLISAGDTKIHTFHGISNSHIIETTNELRVIDAQFNFKLAGKLKEYIATLDKPLVQVILSHNHPDHWYGSEIFAGETPIATLTSYKRRFKIRGYEIY